MSAGRGGGALADSFHVLVSCSRVGVGGEGGLSFFFVWRYTVLRKGEACERRGGGTFSIILYYFSFTWSEIVGKSLPSLPHCEMREEAVGTFHPLHCLVVSTVLISEYSEPKGRKYIVSPWSPLPLYSSVSLWRGEWWVWGVIGLMIHDCDGCVNEVRKETYKL